MIFIVLFNFTRRAEDGGGADPRPRRNEGGREKEKEEIGGVRKGGGKEGYNVW